MTVAPPARARSHSPSRRDRTARCRATSDDEHAVSTVSAGPSRPSVYAIRPDATLPEAPIPRKPSNSPGASRTPSPWSCVTPVNTPTLRPARACGSMPVRSTASQATSSNSRCCGSIASASRSEMPKNPASKAVASARNPPRSVKGGPPVPASARRSRPRSQPRSVGKFPVVSPPDATRSHSASGESMPPGKRQPIPTIATGSRVLLSAFRVCRSSPVTCLSRRRSWWSSFIGCPRPVSSRDAEFTVDQTGDLVVGGRLPVDVRVDVLVGLLFGLLDGARAGV